MIPVHATYEYHTAVLSLSTYNIKINKLNGEVSITLLSSSLALTTSKSTNSMERSVSHCSLQSQHLQHQNQQTQWRGQYLTALFSLSTYNIKANKLSGEVSITLLSSVSALTTSKATNSVERSVSHCSLQSQHLQHQNQQTQWRGQYHTALFSEACCHLLVPPPPTPIH